MPAPPRPSELLKGARLGGYEVGSLIGHGGMASVFEGTNVGLDKSVAIKVLHEHVAQSEPMRARFLREARLAATLEHPHVVTILDVGEQGEVAYIVMERLQGEDLAANLRAVRKLSLQDALAVLLPVAAALASAHDRGIVHRDLKPANVFLARDHRGDLLPKIVDFGLSKSLALPDAQALTEPDVVIGTLEYMAPEQTFGTRRSEAKSDQYALGVILYEAVTGRLPFEGRDAKQLLEAVRYAPLMLPSALEPSLPAALDDVVVQALARDPSHRFEGVRELGRALLPLADPRTARAWERDFSKPSGKVAILEVAKTDTDTDTLVTVPPPAPPLPCEPGTSTFYVKGIAWRGVVHLAERKVEGGLPALDEELGDARISAFVRQPFLAASRYDLLPMLPVNVAIARIQGRPLDALAADQGAAQARYDARYVAKRAFDAMTLETAAEHLPRLAGQYYDTGECTAELVAAGCMLLRRKRLPLYVLPWFAPIHAAYAEEMIRLKGARSVESATREPMDSGTRKGVAMVDLDVEIRWR
jgi:tRNA A-37 threonylcarbamoyl transferase component Bud32